MAKPLFGWGRPEHANGSEALALARFCPPPASSPLLSPPLESNSLTATARLGNKREKPRKP